MSVFTEETFLVVSVNKKIATPEIINPDKEMAKAGDISDTKVKDDTRPFLNFTYMFSSIMGVDFLASTAYKHNIKAHYDANNALGVNGAGDLNAYEFKQRPLALGVTFYPRGSGASRFHPYLGAGTIYTSLSLKLHNDSVEFMRNNLDEQIRRNSSTWDPTMLDRWAEQKRTELEGTIDNMRNTASRYLRKNNWGAYATAGADFNLTDNLLLSTQLRYNYAASDFTYLKGLY